jgi:hypothetical protein
MFAVGNDHAKLLLPTTCSCSSLPAIMAQMSQTCATYMEKEATQAGKAKAKGRIIGTQEQKEIRGKYHVVETKYQELFQAAIQVFDGQSKQ